VVGNGPVDNFQIFVVDFSTASIGFLFWASHHTPFVAVDVTFTGRRLAMFVHTRVMDVRVRSRGPGAMNYRVFGVVNVAGVAQPGSNSSFRCAAGVMRSVIFGLAHLFAPFALTALIKAATLRTWRTSDWSVLALQTGLTIQSSARARSAFADVRCEFVTEFHRLKIALGAMQLLATIPARTRTIGRVIADHVADLRNSGRPR
jgi:hypothetical protein